MYYRFGAYSFDTQRYELRQAGASIPLRPKVFQVLAYLLAHHERVVSKEELLEHLWPGQFVGDVGLNSYIMEVRKALEDRRPPHQCIRTIRGHGCRFVAPVEAPPPLPSRSAVLAPTTEADLAWSVAPRADEEYKPVSVLCCGLLDAPALETVLGPEGLYRVTQTVVALAHEVLQSYGGTMTHQAPEGFTAVFGAPVAHEDHARRAVLAALDLQQRLRQHPTLRAPALGAGLAISMGVHSGLVVVGALGPASHRQVTVIGTPTQGATRLQQQAAPGMLLVSATTYHLVHEEVRGEFYGSLVLDGRQEPLPVYVVQGLLQRRAGVLQRTPRSRSPFVGRQRELALLHDRLEAVRAGEGQVVSLVGLPGMGKTRLLTEFGRRLSPEQVTPSVTTDALQNLSLRVAWLSEACRLAGCGDEAWQHARQALDLARQQKERGTEVHALHQLGVVYAYADPPDVMQAEAHYQQALAEELGMRPLVAHCHLGLGRLYGQIGCDEQARAALTTAIDLYRAMDMTFWLPQAEAALAQVR